MIKVNSVTEYIEIHEQWEKELVEARSVLLEYPFLESIKWSNPVYSFNGKNVIGLSAHKNHMGIYFFNGNLLKKHTQLLINAQEGKTNMLRQLKLKKGETVNIDSWRPYIEEAIENAKNNVKLKKSRPVEVEIPEILKRELEGDIKLCNAFKSLTPGKKKDYCEYISSAKRQETRSSRLVKIKPMILNGHGLNDKYKK